MEDQNKESNIQQEMPEKIELTTFLKKKWCFKGRSSRKEFWFASLFCLILQIVCSILFLLLCSLQPVLSFLLIIPLVIFNLFVLIPASISLCVRRLHDLGIGGIWVFLLFLIATPSFGGPKIFLKSLLAGIYLVVGLPFLLIKDLVAALALIFLIPTFVLFAVLGFVPSQKKTNKYGQYPYETNGAELTNTEDNKDAVEQADDQKSDPEKAQSND